VVAATVYSIWAEGNCGCFPLNSYAAYILVEQLFQLVHVKPGVAKREEIGSSGREILNQDRNRG